MTVADGIPSWAAPPEPSGWSNRDNWSDSDVVWYRDGTDEVMYQYGPGEYMASGNTEVVMVKPNDRTMHHFEPVIITKPAPTPWGKHVALAAGVSSVVTAALTAGAHYLLWR